ncbi:hypothetical protein [Xenorhabdus hominickii]|uniref:Uncharacterized protein n=1 Tax=Xenorhabdus hominickii TaxID=351679 RepID=A0A2G0PZ26_XENHO|nr:hypothetical protein [Xenorhabdus hominickii]AOM42633.1 hypothetical protein A9255_20045 [Xenorhabdus hominickii]PHM52208.1 hypothetical protein Xhom_04587 [Xenorhabdus hominickii]
MYRSHYDSGPSLEVTLFILIIIALVGLVIGFFIIRYASRANELLDVQKKALRELKIQTAILSGDIGSVIINSIYLDEIRKIQSADMLERGGSVSHPKILNVARIYNSFMAEIETKNLPIFSAKKAFESEIERISCELNERQKISFLNVYRENIK